MEIDVCKVSWYLVDRWMAGAVMKDRKEMPRRHRAAHDGVSLAKQRHDAPAPREHAAL
jgi:hypothetical protein